MQRVTSMFPEATSQSSHGNSLSFHDVLNEVDADFQATAEKMYLCRKPLTSDQKRIKEERERVSVTIEQQLLDCLVWNKEHPIDRVEIKIKTPRSWTHPSIKYSKEFRKIENILYDDSTLLPERTKKDKDALSSLRQNHAGMLSLMDVWKIERQIHETKLYKSCEKILLDFIEWNQAHSSEQVQFSISTPFIWKHEYIQPTVGNVYRIVQDIPRHGKNEVITEQELHERFQTRLKDLRFQDYLLQSEFGKDDSDDEKEGEALTPIPQSEVCTRPYHIPCPVPLTKSHQMGDTVTRYMAQSSRMMANSPERFTFDWSGRFIVQKSDWRLNMEAKRKAKELAFRRKYMPAEQSKMTILRQTGLPPELINILFRTSVTPPESVRKEHQRLFFSPLIMGDTTHQFKGSQPLLISKHPRPIMAHCVIEEEDTRRFNLAVYLGTTEIMPTLKEESDLENFMTLPVNKNSTGLDDEKIDYSMVDLYVYEGGSHLNVPGALNLSYELKLGHQCGHEEKLRSLRDLHEDLKMHSDVTGEPINCCHSQAIYKMMKHRKPLVIKGRRFSRKKHSRLRRRVVDRGLPLTEKCTMIPQLNMEQDIELNEKDLYLPRKSSSFSSVLDQHGLIQPPTKCCMHGPCYGRECIEFKINDMALRLSVHLGRDSINMGKPVLSENSTPHGHVQNNDKNPTVEISDKNSKASDHTAIIIDNSQNEKSTLTKKWSSLKEKLKPVLKLNLSKRIFTKSHNDDVFVDKSAEMLKAAISPRTRNIPQSLEGQSDQSYQNHGSPRIRESADNKNSGEGDLITHTQSERESKDETHGHETNGDNSEEAHNNTGSSNKNAGQDEVLPVKVNGKSKNAYASFDIGFEPLKNGKKKPTLSSDRRVKKTKSENDKLRTTTYQDDNVQADTLDLSDPSEGISVEFTQTQRSCLVGVPEGNNSHNARQGASDHTTTSSTSYIDNTPFSSTSYQSYALELARNNKEVDQEYPSEQYSEEIDDDEDDDDLYNDSQIRRNRATEFTANYPVPAEWLEDPYQSSESESDDEIVYTEEQKRRYEEFETRIQILQASMDVEQEEECQNEYRPLFIIYEDEEDEYESDDDAMDARPTWDYQKLPNPYLTMLTASNETTVDVTEDIYGYHREREVRMNAGRDQTSHFVAKNDSFDGEIAKRNRMVTQSGAESQQIQLEHDFKHLSGASRKRELPSRIPVRCDANIWQAMRGKTNATPIQPAPGSRIPILVQNTSFRQTETKASVATSFPTDSSESRIPVRNTRSTLPGKSQAMPMKVTPGSRIQHGSKVKASNAALPQEESNGEIKRGKETHTYIPIRQDQDIWSQMQGKSEATPIKPIPGSRIPIRVTSSDHETGRANRRADSFTQSSRSAGKIPARAAEYAWGKDEDDPATRIKRRNYYQEKKMAALRNNVVKHPADNTKNTADNELHIQKQQTGIERRKFQPSPPTKPKECEAPRFRRSRFSPTGIENGEIGTYLQPSPPPFPKDCETAKFRRSRFLPIENTSSNRDHNDERKWRNISSRPPSYDTRHSLKLNSCETDDIPAGILQNTERYMSPTPPPAPRSRFPPLKTKGRPSFVALSKDDNETISNRTDVPATFMGSDDFEYEMRLPQKQNCGMTNRPSSSSKRLKLPPIGRRTGQ